MWASLTCSPLLYSLTVVSTFLQLVGRLTRVPALREQLWCALGVSLHL